MTQNQKADDLISEFFDYVSWGVEDADRIAKENAKQCAIICVEQIIEAAKEFDDNLDKWEGVRMHPEIFWQEVLDILKAA